MTGYDGALLGAALEPSTTITVPPTDITVTANYENHSLVHRDGKAPTCTEPGWEAYDSCTDCGYSTKKEIPATGHTAGTEWKSDGTSRWKICTVCGAEVEKEAVTIPPEEAGEEVSGEGAGIASPQTGDSSNIVLWLVVMIVTGAVLISTYAYRKKSL